ncbi:MAG: hypothetical protein AWM53_01991 [Candidatus Dichloromethanomonas elyunquensis]|nr:MAG: hypothetical protein AWM53_01991 [Candidatus Dichloromethanomonas elyunquensis]
MTIAKCLHYKPIDSKEKVNCINCKRWAGKKCKDEALMLAEYEKRHGAYEHMMRENKGVMIDS